MRSLLNRNLPCACNRDTRLSTCEANNYSRSSYWHRRTYLVIGIAQQRSVRMRCRHIFTVWAHANGALGSYTAVILR